MRKCTARVWKIALTPEKVGNWIEIAGIFHQFGQSFVEFESGAGNYTTAIVEDSEGRVWEAEVASLRFLEP